MSFLENPNSDTGSALLASNNIWTGTNEFDNSVQLGSATVDCSTFTMIKGAQTSDPQVQLYLSGDANGNFIIATDTGDMFLNSAGGGVEVNGVTAAPTLRLQSGDTAPSANDLVGTIDLWGYNDAGTPAAANFASINGAIIDNTAGAEYGSLNLAITANSVTNSNVLTIVDGTPYGMGGFTLFMLGSDLPSNAVTILGNNSEDDANASDTALYAADGGEPTSGAGFNGGSLYLGSGIGTDAADGDTNGGNGGSLYISAGLGGALSGAGANGTDGVVYLGYDETDTYDVNVGNGLMVYDVSASSVTTNGVTIYTPSADQARANDSTITVANTIVRVVGDGAAVVLDTNPAIADGTADGQLLILQGTSDANTVQIADAVNTALSGGVAMTLGQNDTLTLIWDSGESLWLEQSRSDN